MQTEIEFSVFGVRRDGVRIKDARKKMIRERPRPTNITELRSFLGLAQFFRRFIKDFSETALPLTNLTRKHGNISQYNKRCESAFTQMEDALVSAPVLRAPNWNRPFRFHTDASQKAVGGSLTPLD